jgi:putative restriction endonuclease
MKAVFQTKIDSRYDDEREFRYHVPHTYLNQVTAALGDWIVYYEPRRPTADLSSRGGRQSYFATARLESINADPTLPDHYYAFLSGYLEFDRPVPFKEGAYYYEGALRKSDGSTNKGAAGRAVRTMSESEYDTILKAGFAALLGAPENPASAAYELADEPAEFQRPVVERVAARPFRDAAFAKAVRAAYDNSCAITGLRIINGGGRPEVQAAHIRPVAQSGPDSVRNGMALSGTLHWMFDRGLISVDDDYRILLARQRVPDTLSRMFNTDGKLCPPSRVEFRPHRQFLRFHRETIFKG